MQVLKIKCLYRLKYTTSSLAQQKRCVTQISDYKLFNKKQNCSK